MIQQIADSVYVETGVPGCNHGIVVTDEGVVMIDTPWYPGDAVKWREYIARLGQIRYIINNEPHSDHMAGNFFFPGTVVGHEGTRTVILATPVKQYVDTVRQTEPASLPLVEKYAYRPPTITFTERMSLHLGKKMIELIHVPGHSYSQTAVYLPEERVLFTSDNVVGSMPFFTEQSVPLRWVGSLQRMEQMDVKTIVPGHGELCDKSYLPVMAANVQGMIDAVSAAIKKGLSRAEALDKVEMPSRGQPAMPPERQVQMRHMMVGNLYDLLTKKS